MSLFSNYKQIQMFSLLFLICSGISTELTKVRTTFSVDIMVCLLYSLFQDEQIDWGKQELTFSEIQHEVKEYNAQTNSNLYMVLVSADCHYAIL